MSRLDELPLSVSSYLRGFVRRWRRVVALRAAGASLAMIALWMLGAGAVDRLHPLSAFMRAASLAAMAFTAIAVGVYRLRRIGRAVDWVATAALIERHDPRFNQALVTVTSRLLGAPEQRGSDEILAHLVRDVEQRAADKQQRQLVSPRSAAGPWMLALGLSLAMLVLSQIPAVGGRQLFTRMVRPTADIPPVTTTRLIVSPGDADVMQAEPFHLDVEAVRLGANPVLLYLSDDGSSWTRYAMDAVSPDHFAYTLNTVGRDVEYYVTGGDARSKMFAVRVKRPPAVAEYRIQYTYPAYTRRAPSSVTSASGQIEAPAGSDALLTIASTEPLQSALLTVGGQKLLMDRTQPDSPNLRQARLHVSADGEYDVDLISTREVRGGSTRNPIRATPDHPPLVRFAQAGQTLRLNPRDVIPLSYQAMDDYGLDAVEIVAQVGAANPIRIPLSLSGDRRRQEDAVSFDLGSLRFNVGDVLTLAIAARDTAGQETLSDELRVLVSPRSIDAGARERIDELTAAGGYAKSVGDELDAAVKAMEETDAQKDRLSGAYLAIAARASRHLTSASQAATLLRQSLLRAAARSGSTELSEALCGWMDQAILEAQTADEVFRRSGGTEAMGAELRDRTRQMIEPARQLSTQIGAAARGERATALLIDRDDLKAVSASAAGADPRAIERLSRTLQHVTEEIAAGARLVAVDTSAADADAQLKARVEEEKNLLRSRQPVDFAAAAREWSQALQRDAHQHTPMEARLSGDAQAQAVRKDADLQCAQDQELSARAAAAIELNINATPTGRPVAPGQLNAFAAAVAALQREHVLSRQPAGSRSADEMRIAGDVAAHAREELARFAQQPASHGKEATAAARSAEMEALALRAGAQASRRDYITVAKADTELTKKLMEAAMAPGGRPMAAVHSPATSQLVEERVQHIQQTARKVSEQMSAAQSVDQLGQAEDRLAAESRTAKSASQELAGKQRVVAEQIASVERQQGKEGFPPAAGVKGDTDDPNWRGRATAALLFAQEELAAMPQELAFAQEADARRRKASERAAAARNEADHADPERRPMLARAADQAEQDARDAAGQFEQAVKPVAPEAAADLVDRLEPFAPEASRAREVVAGALRKSLADMTAASRQPDRDAVARAAADALRAIDAAQKELVEAQDQFTARDPLLAAKWFARAAADSLSRRPNDLRTALAHENNASLALSRAWDRSIHRAAELRLAELPSLQAVYAATAISPETTASTSGGAREWARLHARETDDLTATMHEPDPPGFEEPLRLYFEALGKAQQRPK